MGAVGKVLCKAASAVSSVVTHVTDEVGRVLKKNKMGAVGNAVSKVGKAVGGAVKGVVHAAVTDPIGTAAKITVAIVAPAYLPLVVAADDAAHGKSLECIAINAAAAYVGGNLAKAAVAGATASSIGMSTATANLVVAPAVQGATNYAANVIAGKDADLATSLANSYVNAAVATGVKYAGNAICNAIENMKTGSADAAGSTGALPTSSTATGSSSGSATTGGLPSTSDYNLQEVVISDALPSAPLSLGLTSNAPPAITTQPAVTTQPAAKTCEKKTEPVVTQPETTQPATAQPATQLCEVIINSTPCTSPLSLGLTNTSNQPDASTGSAATTTTTGALPTCQPAQTTTTEPAKTTASEPETVGGKPVCAKTTCQLCEVVINSTPCASPLDLGLTGSTSTTTTCAPTGGAATASTTCSAATSNTCAATTSATCQQPVALCEVVINSAPCASPLDLGLTGSTSATTTCAPTGGAATASTACSAVTSNTCAATTSATCQQPATELCEVVINSTACTSPLDLGLTSSATTSNCSSTGSASTTTCGAGTGTTQEPYNLEEVLIQDSVPQPPPDFGYQPYAGNPCATYNPCTGNYDLEEVVITDKACEPPPDYNLDEVVICGTPCKAEEQPAAKKKWKFPWKSLRSYCSPCDSFAGAYIPGMYDQRWLNTDPNFLNYKFNTNDQFANIGCKGGTTGAAPKAPTAEEIRNIKSQMTPCLSSLLEDRLNLQGCSATPSLMELAPANFLNDPYVTGLGGFASGGSSSSSSTPMSRIKGSFCDLCKCLEKQTDVLTAMFSKCGPDTLSPIYGAIGNRERMLNKFKHIYPHISDRGNIGLASGGLPTKYAQAAPEGHNPEFITGMTGYYAQGGGTGQSDDIPAMLHDGDYVMDADTVAAFGDGSSKAGSQVMQDFMSKVPHARTMGGKAVPAKIADGEYVFPESFVTALGGGDNKRGAKILDAMRAQLREHKRSAPNSSIPPKAKSPFEYIKKALG